MFTFMAGVASGMYIYHKYDVEQLIEDVKPAACSSHKSSSPQDDLHNNSTQAASPTNEENKWSTDNMWDKIKSFEQQYRKPEKTQN